MYLIVRLVALLGIVGPSVFLPLISSGTPVDRSCRYPSMSDRFGVTAGRDIEEYDLENPYLPVDNFLDWRAHEYDSYPHNMEYYPTLVVGKTKAGFYFYHPRGWELEQAVRLYPGATWLIGNEADTIWKHNTPPKVYARLYHDAYTTIKALDPEARFAFTSLATVSTLRLAWIDQVWEAYRNQFGADMPVDVWNIHTYVVNEMHNEWGAEVPTGIDNAVGYSDDTWVEVADAGASGGTVHQSNNLSSRAYFAFHGDQVTLYLRTGPDAGEAEVRIDPSLGTATSLLTDVVDLYAPSPGTITRTYTDLVPPGGVREDRHNVRVQVIGTKNPASGGTWVRVDAIEAASTADLAGGRLEDDSPLRARIVTNIDDYDNVDMIVEQIRTFRQWMADHGQRNKPLINTEYGVLMTEDLGFDYERVRDFMLTSFDRFVNDLQDPELGFPADDNRLLQHWFWFSLAQDEFEDRAVQTGLYSQTTHQIKPLGLDFINYLTPLVTPYSDLQIGSLSLSPTWPLFAGQPSLVQVDATVRNRGNTASGPFNVRLADGANTLLDWPVSGLERRFTVSDTVAFHYDWQPVVSGDRLLVLTADDSSGPANDPCHNNNSQRMTLEAPQYTDLALSGLTTVPRLLPDVASGETLTVPLQVALTNLGSIGTAAGQITVNFWNGDPVAGGELIHSEVLLPGSTELPVVLDYDWPNRSPGIYDLVVEVDAVPEETDVENNRQEMRVVVSTDKVFLPAVTFQSQPEQVAAMPVPLQASNASNERAYWLPK